MLDIITLFQVALALVEVYSPALLATADEIDAFQVGGGLIGSCFLPGEGGGLPGGQEDPAG